MDVESGVRAVFLVMSSVAAQQNVPSDATAAAAVAPDAAGAADDAGEPAASAATLALNLAQLRRGEMTPTNSGEKRRIDMQREL